MNVAQNRAQLASLGLLLLTPPQQCALQSDPRAQTPVSLHPDVAHPQINRRGSPLPCHPLIQPSRQPPEALSSYLIWCSAGFDRCTCRMVSIFHRPAASGMLSSFVVPFCRSSRTCVWLLRAAMPLRVSGWCGFRHSYSRTVVGCPGWCLCVYMCSVKLYDMIPAEVFYIH